MKHSYILSLTIGLLVATSLVGCQAAPDDNKSLQGTWTLVSGEKDGQPLPEQDIKNSKLTIAGDTHTVQIGELIIKGTHKLDATKKPKQIDALDTEGPTIGQTFGIYELTSAGEFRVSFDSNGKDRPTDFVTKPDSGRFTHTWKRTKSE